MLLQHGGAALRAELRQGLERLAHSQRDQRGKSNHLPGDTGHVGDTLALWAVQQGLQVLWSLPLRLQEGLSSEVLA